MERHNCSELMWITASHSKRHTLPPSADIHVCHSHVAVTPQSSHFWRQKWIAVRNHLLRHPQTRVAMVTDLYDVHVNPYPARSVLSQFRELTPPGSVLLSAEDSCWIGRVCSRADVQRFRDAKPTAQRFMQSQFMGRRDDLLHMLQWGLNTGSTDDMHMIYEYTLAHPDRVTLDERYAMFGSLAFADLNANATYMCRDGRCGASARRYSCRRHPDHRGVCVTSSDRREHFCPLVWHGNGLLSRSFFRTNPQCLHAFGRRLK